MIGVLLSGGIDSTALSFMEKPDVAFNINYGQKAAEAERSASVAICEVLGIELIDIDVNCSSLGSGDLVGGAAISTAPESDWWPYRNQLLITLCVMKAVELGCSKLLIGTVKSDQYHTDGTKGFIRKISDLISYQEGGIIVEAPAIEKTTAELVTSSGIPFEILAWSHSCHKANVPCTNCRGCSKHFETLNELGFYGQQY